MKALAFGEILWDVNGNEKTIGGAPLNVLAHIRRLGGEASIISAVGSDELGRDSLACLEDFGIAEQYVRISPFPTGRADVVLENGIPSYEFNMPCAWDDIRLSDDQYADLFNDEFSVFIYGTLAQRCLTSALTLEKLLDDVSAAEFFFREPWCVRCCQSIIQEKRLVIRSTSYIFHRLLQRILQCSSPRYTVLSPRQCLNIQSQRIFHHHYLHYFFFPHYLHQL